MSASRSASRRASTSRGVQFSLGEAFGESFRVLGRRFFPILAITLTVVFPFLLLLGAIAAVPEAFGDFGLWFVGAWGLIFGLVVGPATTAATTKVVVADLNGRGVGLVAALGFGFRRFLPVLGASLVFGLVVGLGLVVLIIPGLLFLTWFYVCIPSIVAEDRGVMESFSRSKDLVKGNGWGVFGLLVLVALVTGGVNQAAEYIIGASGMAGIVGLVITIVLVGAIQAVVGTLSVVAPAVAYMRLRAEKEGIGISELASLVDRIGDED